MQAPTCDRHPEAKLKKLSKPPYTANRQRLTDSGKRVCDFYDYWRCPVCKTHYSTAKA